jgi:iron complex transport system substrate-binding protein
LTGNARRPPVSVVFLVGRTPGAVEGLYAAGRGTYLDDLLAVAGARNVMRDAPFPFVKLPLETLIARDPDVIIDMGDAAHADAAGRESAAAVARLWQARLPNLRAVRNGRVAAVADDKYVVPGPRILEAVAGFRRILHPGARP